MTTCGGPSPDGCHRSSFVDFNCFRFPPDCESATATNRKERLVMASAISSTTAPEAHSWLSFDRTPICEHTSASADESAAIDLRITRETNEYDGPQRRPSQLTASWLHSPPATTGGTLDEYRTDDDQPLNLTTTTDCRNTRTDGGGCYDDSATDDCRRGRWEDNTWRCCCCSWCDRRQDESTKDRKHVMVAAATPPYTPTSAGSQRSSSMAADADSRTNVSRMLTSAEVMLQRQGWHCSKPETLQSFRADIVLSKLTER